MEQLKKAYERLGLTETATREEVEKRFDLLVRQDRSRKRAGESGDSDFDEVIKAYRTIVDQEDQQVIEQLNQERYAKWGSLAGPAEKVSDFFRLYKFRVILSVIIVGVLIAGGVTYKNYRDEQNRLAKLPPVDLSIMLIGNFGTNDDEHGVENLEKAFLKNFPDWKRLSLKLTYLPPETENELGMGQMDMAMRQKAQLEVMTENPDIYILDKSTFAWLGQSTVLEPLDENLVNLAPETARMKAKSEDDPAPRVYGIDITQSPLLKDLPLGRDDMIAAIRIDPKNKEKAVQFIEKYLTAK
ncbi:molecular chaperone DnaJ [Paenibacillus sp. CAA11]|uniref:molecular chaperone DnaJ n=1 Tax=Paenibacillus sp. CAA11 TaxID=1532905 RepID=UPI000D346F44|nr:molecular chaperone DnaJ [Paenibacillus sp. CAA11]AWB44206.1 molecular chaperone DnaJ [Paenibacillus sp. CAA11]